MLDDELVELFRAYARRIVCETPPGIEMSFREELKRRNVVKVAIACAISGAPGGVLPVLVLLLAMGFVVALILSWDYELTPQGVKRIEAFPRDGRITHERAPR